MELNSHKKRIFYLVILICYGILSASRMVVLFDAISAGDKPRIIKNLVLLMLFLIAFVGFVIVYRKTEKEKTPHE